MGFFHYTDFESTISFLITIKEMGKEEAFNKGIKVPFLLWMHHMKSSMANVQSLYDRIRDIA